MRRQTYEEAMALAPLPPATPGGNVSFISRRPAWLPGSDLTAELDRLRSTGVPFPVHMAAYGGHVYAQAAAAACKALPPGSASTDGMGLHTIHGYFTAVGWPDRPFVYETSIATRGRSFVTARVDARQPLQPGVADKDGLFPVHADAPLGAVCFTALVSFVVPRPHSFGADYQEESVQKRFASILQSRAPSAWNPSPPADIELLLSFMNRRDIVGTFPMVDMKKVDMAAYNADRPLYEKREIILYRLLAPLSSETTTPNDHVIVHVYAADRNGLLMATNHLKFHVHDKVATLSNSFVVHTNVADAQMECGDAAEADNDLRGWWIQEVCFSRASAGRAVVQYKIWSPAGVHVATQYQDGLCIALQGKNGDIVVKL